MNTDETTDNGNVFGLKGGMAIMATHQHAWTPFTEKIIGAAYEVSNTLGCSFLEKVYENALAHELRKNALKVQQQLAIVVRYVRSRCRRIRRRSARGGDCFDRTEGRFVARQGS